jgi:hypothetical protein
MLDDTAVVCLLFGLPPLSYGYPARKFRPLFLCHLQSAALTSKTPHHSHMRPD